MILLHPVVARDPQLRQLVEYRTERRAYWVDGKRAELVEVPSRERDDDALAAAGRE